MRRIPLKPSGLLAGNGAFGPTTSGVEYLVYTQEKSRKEAKEREKKANAAAGNAK